MDSRYVLHEDDRELFLHSTLEEWHLVFIYRSELSKGLWCSHMSKQQWEKCNNRFKCKVAFIKSSKKMNTLNQSN